MTTKTCGLLIGLAYNSYTFQEVSKTSSIVVNAYMCVGPHIRDSLVLCDQINFNGMFVLYYWFIVTGDVHVLSCSVETSMAWSTEGTSPSGTGRILRAFIYMYTHISSVGNAFLCTCCYRSSSIWDLFFSSSRLQ